MLTWGFWDALATHAGLACLCLCVCVCTLSVARKGKKDEKKTVKENKYALKSNLWRASVTVHVVFRTIRC